MSVIIVLVRSIDSLNDWVGRTISWLTVIMVAIVFFVVVLRYLFSVGWIAMQETYVWMHGTIFMLAAAYTFLHDGHVRIDIFYRDARQTYKSLVNILGCLFFVLPVLWIVGSKGLPFVERSWGRLESSAEAGGLPGLYFFKTIILVFCFLFSLQAISLTLRSIAELLGREIPRPAAEKIQKPDS